VRLPSKAIDLIETWRLGFVATVSADGRPNVSPKGTFIVLDEETIAFGEMRSPNTMANLAHQSEVEVSFVDVLSRKGVRIRGEARIIEPSAEYDALTPKFQSIWGDELLTMFNVFIVISCAEVKPLQSPIFETGYQESDLRAQWKSKIAGMPT
jgi:predicted pyridoxine 5'-phosphate oxidase superfamily flavin-nucleotide-binding protein